MVTAKKKIEDLWAQSCLLKDQAKDIERLVEVFPDLEISTNRWKTERYTSVSVNDRATDVIIGYNCGCCEDKPVEVWPYLVHAGQQIYSRPPSFMVGERNPYSGRDKSYPDWQTDLRKANISESVIKIVEEYFVREESGDCEESDDD